MSESLLSLLVVLHVVCWRIGGLWQKWVRRYVLPLLTISILLLIGAVWWVALASGLTEMVVLTLPYGEHTSWPLRVLVFASYGLPAIWLDWTFIWLWMLIPAVTCSAVLAASHRWNRVHHLVFECTAGLTQGSVLVIAWLR